VAQGEGPEFKPQHCKKKKSSPVSFRLNISVSELNVVVYICNPTYSGDGDWRTVVEHQPRQKVMETLSQQISQA
jgi:hypothetical protein